MSRRGPEKRLVVQKNYEYGLVLESAMFRVRMLGQSDTENRLEKYVEYHSQRCETEILANL